MFGFEGSSIGSFYRRGRTLQKRSMKRGRARAQARARTRIRREQGTSKSRGEIDPVLPGGVKEEVKDQLRRL
jgi:hypothetical protein